MPPTHDGPGRDEPPDPRRVAAIAARGFHDDPVMSWVFPDPVERTAALELSFERLAWRFAARGGRIDVLDDACTALWLGPDPPPAPDEPTPPSDRPWHLLTPQAMERFSVLGAAMEASHPAEPHWYLGVVASLPDQQGRGLGRRILEPVLRNCDDRGVPSYLESSNARNLPFYYRLGFAQVGEITIPDGPSLYPMWRAPGAATG